MLRIPQLKLKKAFNMLPVRTKKRIKKIATPIFVKKRIREWDGKPDIVLIENTNHCNAKCVMCPHMTMKRKQGIMPFDIYKQTIEECTSLGIQRIQLTGTGEPLLDPLLFERIHYAKNAGIGEINMFTNASLLNKKNQEQLLDSGIDLVCLSIDGFTPETYEKIRPGLSFEDVKENTLSFLKMKKTRKTNKPFIVVSGLNVGENLSNHLKNDFYEEMLNLSDRLSLAEKEETHDWAGSVKKVGSAVFLRYASPCRRLWDSLSILWDGRVSLCCIDYEGSIILGDINKQSILEIWNCKQINELRKYHLNLEFDKIALCKNCYERPSWIPKRTERTLDNLELSS